MRRFIRRRLGGAFVALVSLSAAGLAGAVARQAAPEWGKVTLQLKWVTQAQFAGYYVAQANGYYRAAGLDVSLKPGGPHDEKNQEIATRFLEASLKGWAYCHEHLREGTAIVLRNAPALGHGHQTWQLNEVNALIWPAPRGIGVMDPASFQRTARIARQFHVIRSAPSGAYRNDLATAAVRQLQQQGIDVYGKRWRKAAVTVTPGGR